MFAPARRAWTSLSPPTRQFGVPFIVFLVTGTYGLSFLTAGRYELDDERRVRSQIGADPRKPVARTPPVRQHQRRQPRPMGRAWRQTTPSCGSRGGGSGRRHAPAELPVVGRGGRCQRLGGWASGGQVGRGGRAGGRCGAALRGRHGGWLRDAARSASRSVRCLRFPCQKGLLRWGVSAFMLAGPPSIVELPVLVRPAGGAADNNKQPLNEEPFHRGWYDWKGWGATCRHSTSPAGGDLQVH